MNYFNEMKAILTKIREKLNYGSIEEVNKSLEDYLNDEDIGKVAELLMKINYSDIESKFIANTGYFEGKPTMIPEDINYINIIEDPPYYSVGIFFMPKGSVIPLHDHTNLMVLSKCLFGSLEVKSYDKLSYKDKNMYIDLITANSLKSS
jgi:hypothetical protein